MSRRQASAAPTVCAAPTEKAAIGIMLIDESGRREPTLYKSKPTPQQTKPRRARLRFWKR